MWIVIIRIMKLRNVKRKTLFNSTITEVKPPFRLPVYNTFADLPADPCGCRTKVPPCHSVLLLMVNVLIGLMSVAECPGARFMGPILFVIFVNDIEDAICGNILKFADDTKVFCKVCNNDNCPTLRVDLRKLYN